MKLQRYFSAKKSLFLLRRKFFRSVVVTVQNRTFTGLGEHDPFVWVPESKEEVAHCVNLHIGKHPVLGHATCNKAFRSKESWVVL